MCGIAGILTSSNATFPDLAERLATMTHAMHHRGPDDEGMYVSSDGRVGLGNRRLAVRDLSPAGHMPMASGNGLVWITYNGEIYNTDELRLELEREGYSFASNSDTEVILHGYEAWGAGVVSRLEGMFAFAIYDSRQAPKLFIARDQLGIKPLYYAFTSDAFVFASELKSLLSSGLVSKEISPAGLVGYLQMGSVPNPLTIYRDISALEPGSAFEFALNKWTLPQPTRYWTLPTNTVESSSFEQAVEDIEACFANAVRVRLVSDVPLGAFLSGGLDSSLIVAMMRRATSGPIRTCSIAFNEQSHSEAVYARAMAQAVGAEHFEQVVTAEDVISEFDHILLAMDQPSVDGVNTYFVSKTARAAGLTVALSGLGGDELFGGYAHTFRDVPSMLKALKVAHAVPGGAELARRALQLFYRRPGWGRVGDALERPPSLASAYLTRRGLFSEREVRKLVHPDMWAVAMSEFDPVKYVAHRADSPNGEPHDAFSWVSRAELRTYTHNQLLRDTDVMSMAHSLEVRVPFFDTRLVESALRLPTSIKVDGSSIPKPILASIARRNIPKSVAERREKQGFSFPFDSWLREGLHNRVGQILPEIARDLHIECDELLSVQRQHQAGKIHWSRLWALTALGAVLK